MGTQVTARDLDLDDGIDEEADGAEDLANPTPDEGEDSSAKIKGAPDHGDIGAEVVEKQVEEQRKRQKEAEDEALKDRLAEDEQGKEKKKYEYKNQEAAERAVREAKQKMHEATAAAKAAEKAKADLEERLKAADAESNKVETPGENPYVKKRHEVSASTTAKANALERPVPPSDPNDPSYGSKVKEYQKDIDKYNLKVAELWADAQAEIAKITLEEHRQEEADRSAVTKAVDDALIEAGLITEGMDNKSIQTVKKMFWGIANTVPKNLSLEDQIKQTVAEATAFVKNLISNERKKAQQAKDATDNLDVLGRGTKVRETVKKEAEGSPSMWAAQRTVLEKRRLRHNP